MVRCHWLSTVQSHPLAGGPPSISLRKTHQVCRVLSALLQGTGSGRWTHPPGSVYICQCPCNWWHNPRFAPRFWPGNFPLACRSASTPLLVALWVLKANYVSKYFEIYTFSTGRTITPISTWRLFLCTRVFGYFICLGLKYSHPQSVQTVHVVRSR